MRSADIWRSIYGNFINKFCLETTMKPLLVAHAEDPDGIIARTLLMRHFGISRDPEDHVFVRYDRIAEAFQEAQQKARNHKSVFIADVDVNGRLYAAATVSSLFEK